MVDHVVCIVKIVVLDLIIVSFFCCTWLFFFRLYVRIWNVEEAIKKFALVLW